MPPVSDPFSSFVQVLAKALAAEPAPLLVPQAPERVYLADCVAAGAPSAKWLRAQDIDIHGPRGRQWVYASELATLLTKAKARRHSCVRRSAPVVDLRRDAADEVATLLRGAA
jgi:hypothetical protein